MSLPIRPYVGLRPYRHDENFIFFGRDAQITELLERLHKNRFVAVIGTSGCGKSSLIRAGLIPALKGGYLVEDSSKWLIAKMKPGEAPMYYLARSILELEGKTDKDSIKTLVTQIKKSGVSALLDHIRTSLKKHKSNLFLLVDQFEELFRFSTDQNIIKSKTESIDFVNTILKLANQNLVPVYVVITMRSDFIGDCARYHGLPEALNQSQYLVPRLKRSQLKQVIEGPANLYGIRFESSLTSSLINYLGASQDDLPVLQHALLRMWQNEEENENKDGEIDFKDHDAIGGLKKALSQDANEAFNSKSFSKQDKIIAEKIFKALTTIDSNGRKIRKPTALNKLVEISGASEKAVVKIIKTFIGNDRSFLIYDPDGEPDQIIDISHESLIRQWDTLNNWVDDEAKDAQFYKRLCEEQIKNAERLESNPESGPRLLDDIDTQKAIDWRHNFGPTKAWASQYVQGDQKENIFDTCIEFTNTSATQYLKRKRKEWNTRRRNLIMRIIVGAIIILVVSNVYYKSLKPGPIDWTYLQSKNNDKKAWKKVLRNNTLTDYEEFLAYFPDSKHAKVAYDSAQYKSFDARWQKAKGRDSLIGYNDYLNEAIDSSYNVSIKGKELFNTNCAACHSLEENLVGPALKDVEKRLRNNEGLDKEWLYAWIKNSAAVISSGDAYANKIYQEYNSAMQTAFPNLSNSDIDEILTYTNSDSIKYAYSNYARDIAQALIKKDSILTKIELSGNLEDLKLWENAETLNSIKGYIDYLKKTIIGSKRAEAKNKIFNMINVKGKSGFLYCGRESGNFVSDRVFDLVYRDTPDFKKNSMLKNGDIVKLGSSIPRRIYSDVHRNFNTGNNIEINTYYFINSVVLEGTAVIVEIQY